MSPSPHRQQLIVLGASNCARGLVSLVNTARAHAQAPIDFYGAIGHGRSYHNETVVIVRSLPGILSCGLWNDLHPQSEIPSIGLVTDVGNDLLYGAEPAQIESWVDTCLARLTAHGARLVLTELPLANLNKLGPRKFWFFSRLFFPFCQLSLSDAVHKAKELNDRLLNLASRWNATVIKPSPDWYGIDPIHVRYSHYPQAWSQMVGSLLESREETSSGLTPSMSWRMKMRLAWVAPQRRRLLRWVQSTTQPSLILEDGSRIAVY